MDESISPPVHAECRQRRWIEARDPLQKNSRTACPRLPRLALVRQRSLIARIVLAARRHAVRGDVRQVRKRQWRSEEPTSELQSLMRISYAVYCLKKQT